MSQPCSVIIPNYNGARFLRRCIPSLFDAIACHGEEHEVIFVDNGNTESSTMQRDFRVTARLCEMPHLQSTELLDGS